MVFGILRQSKESVMNGGDYGEDEDSFIKAMELEIDIQCDSSGNLSRLATSLFSIVLVIYFFY